MSLWRLGQRRSALPDLAEAQDEDLLKGYASGQRGAAEELTRRLAPRVFAQAWRMLGSESDAEDIVQEALMRLWRIAPDWQTEQARVSTWLYRVTANLCIDRQRALRVRSAAALDDVPEPVAPGQSVAETLDTLHRQVALQKALAALPERQAIAVSLRHMEGLSLPEIAAIMECSVEAAESLVARGKRGLAITLAPRREELGYVS